jgi:hypothetical protein
MKSLLLIALIGFVAYTGYDKFGDVGEEGPEPLYDSSYVVVYGRDTCGITKRFLADLDRLGTPYEYKRVNDSGVNAELHPRMEEAGLSTRRYGLPVVDVNAEMFIRPDPNAVAEKYQQFAKVARKAQVTNARETDRARTTSDPGAIAATRHLTDPLVECTIDGHKTFMFKSQCPR